ncbi:ThiF family adenylyltransferase [Flavihumibacter profundi]|uniref:ThiF family adenylyltransferase n=1 Tax=Flavihumibacter profundi TaxID=2716883 RepID=UPI001CC6066E|nr:ThiF family adenylyltransferase [Flavihumibacter profundi]MBZ5859087.1 ThiF family adenylyltransferase [Flavihumibacter profundi]
MSHQLISHSPDLKRLKDEGYGIQIKGGLLVVHQIPYVNDKKEVQFGKLVSELTLSSPGKTGVPNTHVIHFAGAYPCYPDGSPITALQHASATQEITKGVVIDFSFSNKPGRSYIDYYEKISSYANLISAPAKALREDVSEKSHPVIQEDAEDTVFRYIDTNSSRANITPISEKLQGQKIAIVGSGGTGSYLLDFISKTPVQEIHLFDGDHFHVHNAFRAPGAATVEELNSNLKKVHYLHTKYSQMHRYIIPHDYFITPQTVNELSGMDIVFIAIDKGEIKRLIIDALLNTNVPFIDVGMGLNVKNNTLLGTLRVTSCNLAKKDHLERRISFVDQEDDGYHSNIQIAELNALNAALAIVKWKKMFGFYHDMEKEHHTTYTVNESQLLNDETAE